MRDSADGVEGGDVLVGVGELADAAGVNLVGILATVISLGLQRDVEQIAGQTYLRSWAADRVLSRLAAEKLRVKRHGSGRPLTSWERGVGPQIAAATKLVTIRDGVGIVQVATPGWLAVLQDLTPQILERLVTLNPPINSVRWVLGPSTLWTE